MIKKDNSSWLRMEVIGNNYMEDADSLSNIYVIIITWAGVFQAAASVIGGGYGNEKGYQFLNINGAYDGHGGSEGSIFGPYHRALV